MTIKNKGVETMKKIAKLTMACLLAVLMVAMSFQLPASAATSTGSYVRVRLDSMGTPSSVTMKINGAYYIEEDPTIALTRGNSYTFKVKDGKIMLNDLPVCRAAKFRVILVAVKAF